MKVEKIYLTPLECMAASFQPQKDNTIEYTRTDAFIEKTCEWLRKELCDYFDAPRDNYDMFIEDFRKYMKGE